MSPLLTKQFASFMASVPETQSATSHGQPLLNTNKLTTLKTYANYHIFNKQIRIFCEVILARLVTRVYVMIFQSDV